MPPLNHDRDIAATTNEIAYSCQITSVITIADRLKSAREAAGLSQIELAHQAGVSQGTIANIETGTRKNPRELLSIARAVGVNPEWLKTGKAPRTNEADTNTGHRIESPTARYLTGPQSTAESIAYHVSRIGALLMGVDDVRRNAIAEMLGAAARKPEQADEIGEHIQALANSTVKRAA